MTENLKIDNIALQERLTTKEKEVEKLLLEKEELKARVELLSNSLKEMEYNKLKEEKGVETILLDNMELKARVEVLSKSFIEMQNTLNARLADKENQKVGTIPFENEKLKARDGVPEGSLGLNQIIPLKRNSMPSTSATSQHEDVKKLPHSFENIFSFRPGTKKIFSLSSLESTTSSSVESMPSTKRPSDEAHLLHEFPFLNVPPPGSPDIFSVNPILCEECNKEHVPYFYCFLQPCSACYSKDHHFLDCPYLRYIPQGAEFNRDIYEVGCKLCGDLFDEDVWLCSSCPGGTKSTHLKAKYCVTCKRIGEHSCWECPMDKDKAAHYSSYRDSCFAKAKAQRAESLAESSQLPKQAKSFAWPGKTHVLGKPKPITREEAMSVLEQFCNELSEEEEEKKEKEKKKKEEEQQHRRYLSPFYPLG